MQTVAQLLQSLSIGTPVTAGNLTLFPLLSSGAGPARYRLLDESLDAGLAEVTEVSDGGSVPELHFRNKSDTDILLVDGEELVGAKQNRVLNLTLLVGAGQQVTIPVSCVEAGRWAWQSRRFASGRRKLHARARRDKMRGVSPSMRESGQRARPDIQSAVWSSVQAKMTHFGVASATASLHDVYEATESDLAPVREKFTAQPDQVGAAFAVDGRLVGVELFDAPATLARLLPKLVDSYAFDAFEHRRPGQTGGEVKSPAPDEVRALLAHRAGAAVHLRGGGQGHRRADRRAGAARGSAGRRRAGRAPERVRRRRGAGRSVGAPKADALFAHAALMALGQPLRDAVARGGVDRLPAFGLAGAKRQRWIARRRSVGAPTAERVIRAGRAVVLDVERGGVVSRPAVQPSTAEAGPATWQLAVWRATGHAQAIGFEVRTRINPKRTTT